MSPSENIRFRFCSETKDDRFVGIKISGGEVTFTFPKFLTVPKGSEKKAAKELLQALSFAKRSFPQEKAYADSNMSLEGSDAFMAMLFLLEDYRLRGRYVNRERISIKGGKGKIDWKKTEKQTSLYLTGPNLIYPCLYRKVEEQKDALLVDIYRLTVGKSIDILGWLFNVRKDDYLALAPNFDRASYPRLCQEIEKVRLSSFDDLKRRRLSSMEAVLRSLMGTDLQDGWSYGSENMEDVFEVLIRYVLTGSPLFDGHYDPEYNFTSFAGEKKKIRLRPDAVVEEDRDFYIFDAKYYQYGSNFDPSLLPASDSVLKQFAYAKHIRGTFKPENCFNAFVLPASFDKFDTIKPPRMKGNSVAYAGKITSSIDKEKISVLLIDLTSLIHEWDSNATKLREDLLQGERF